MDKYELSKWDFEALDEALKFAIARGPGKHQARLSELKDKFAAAHTAWIETEN